VGALTLPASGFVYLDTNAVIYSIERIEPFYTVLLPVWQDVAAHSISVITSELTLLEVLVKPLRTGNQRLEVGFRRLLEHTQGVRLVPLSRSMIERAAQLRATTNLKTPDAIHAATALEYHCALFLTNDPAFRQVPGLPVILLSDLLVP
jgi:predicted nucleic acid-binding protein